MCIRDRSGCPLNASVEMLGDRWSLLIIRDMMLQGAHTYKTFLECYEGIATNILDVYKRQYFWSSITAPGLLKSRYTSTLSFPFVSTMP